MATTTPTTTAQIVDPDTTPDVQRAREALDEVTTRYTILDARRNDLERALNPHADSPASEELILEAREHVAEVRVLHARCSRERRQKETAWLTARALAREQVRAQCYELKRALVQQVNEGFSVAEPASRELADVEDRERALTGQWQASAFAWPELSAPSSTQPSRLDDWRIAARTAGLLD